MNDVTLLRMIDKAEIRKIAEAISELLSVKTIFLFGSYAYGSPKENSDIDLCIVTDEKKKKLDILRQIRKNLLNQIQFPLDLLVYSSNEFKDRSERKNSMEYKIANDGIVLYDGKKTVV